ncbi:ACT domain-containing protein [Alteriqipengyuania lutimaris]|uniref:ACT domain-containing protein n=1 Tax=Alteriqipengyuania lutimaris TaxID=1538146 RepID=A0A395LJL6_9SPHN|nr:ACT domain-containing protein [Alteriqipengyuania lutimaris]MBB3033858.1 hypothetical protein [Alteriqipengyuania lutimaris]RDS77173.1 ACT domain-containing protein [Alteriqipengyuania lutimaris]
MTVSETGAMIAAMDPDLDPLFYAFRTGDEIPADAQLFASIEEEEEGTTRILGFAKGEFAGHAHEAYRRIVLRVNSSLDGVGLTAAVSTALAREAIPCNIVAAFHHDHVFVPATRANDAMQILAELQRSHRDG